MAKNMIEQTLLNVYRPFFSVFLIKHLRSNPNENIHQQNVRFPILKPRYLDPSLFDIGRVAIPVLNAAIYHQNIQSNHSYACPNRKELHLDENTHPIVQSVNQYMDKEGIKLSDVVLGLLLKGAEIDVYTAPQSRFLRFATNNHKGLKDAKTEQKISKAFHIDVISDQYSYLKASQNEISEHAFKELCANYAGYYIHNVLAFIKRSIISQVILSDMISNGFDLGTSFDYYQSKSAQDKLLEKIYEKTMLNLSLLMTLKQRNLSEVEKALILEQMDLNEKKILKLCDFFKRSEKTQFESDLLPRNQFLDSENDIEPDTMQGTDTFIETVEEVSTQAIKPVVHSYRLFTKFQAREHTPATCVIMNDFMAALRK